MKKSKRILCGILAIAAVFSFTGCGDKKNAVSGEKVSLKWVMNGPGLQADSERVWASVNEKLKTYPGFENTDITFEVIESSEYKRKFQLLQVSGDPIDIVGTYGLSYDTEVKNNTFLDITDMIDEYAPDVKKEMPEWALKLMTVGGRQYAITNYQQMATPMWGYITNKAEALEYFPMSIEEAEARFQSSDILTEETLDIFEKYFDNLKAAGKLRDGMRPFTTWAMKGYVDVGSNYLYRIEADKVVVENRLKLDTLKMCMDRFSDWYKKGYIRKDILSCEVTKGDYNMNHEQWHKYMNAAKEKAAKTPEATKIVMRSQKNFYLPNTSTSGGNAIMKTSKNPEQALRFLELMYTKKGTDLYRMITYGFEGEHYTKINENRIEPIGYTGSQGNMNSPYGLWKWIIGNTANAFEAPNDPEGWNDYVFNDWNANAIPSKLTGFTLDTTAIDTEYGQVNGVVSEFQNQLTSGALENWEATYEEAMRKLDLAGEEKVRAEIQRQVDEFLAKQ